MKDLPRRSLLKWSFMCCALFWVLVYQLGTTGLDVSGFVYVNF